MQRFFVYNDPSARRKKQPGSGAGSVLGAHKSHAGCSKIHPMASHAAATKAAAQKSVTAQNRDAPGTSPAESKECSQPDPQEEEQEEQEVTADAAQRQNGSDAIKPAPQRGKQVRAKSKYDFASGLHADMGLLTVSPPSTVPALRLVHPLTGRVVSPEDALRQNNRPSRGKSENSKCGKMLNEDEAKDIEDRKEGEEDSRGDESQEGRLWLVFAGETLTFLTGGRIQAPVHYVPSAPIVDHLSSVEQGDKLPAGSLNQTQQNKVKAKVKTAELRCAAPFFLRASPWARLRSPSPKPNRAADASKMGDCGADGEVYLPSCNCVACSCKDISPPPSSVYSSSSLPSAVAATTADEGVIDISCRELMEKHVSYARPWRLGRPQSYPDW